MKTRRNISAAIIAAVSAACLLPGIANAQSTYRSDRNGNPVNGGNADRPGNSRDRLDGTLSTRQQRVSAGNSVSFGYTVTNRSRDTQTYKFSSSRMFDMEAVRVDTGGGRGNSGRRTVWRYSDGQLGAQVLSEFTLRPGQTRSFIGQWQVGRDVPDGTYEVTAFLTPQRDSKTGVSTTRIIVENGRGNDGNNGDGRPGRPGRPGNGNGGWNGGNNNGNNGNNGNGGWNNRDTVDVSDLKGSNVRQYLDRRITVRGTYLKNGNSNSSWLLDGTNIKAITVFGSLPRNARVQDQVTVTGTLRQSRDGALTLQAN
jgi:hypothetical protein